MPQTIVIFGASGDLTSRKLIPSLFALDCRKRLPDDVRIVGASRTAFSHDAWRAALAETTRQFAPKLFSDEAWARFATRVFYHATDVGAVDQMGALAAFLQELDVGAGTRAYYLATAPQHYEPAVAALQAAGLADDSAGPRRVVIEKPFGVDLESARRLNTALHAAFREDQVYRIDHYLGKETVQNMLVLRFANGIFEPIWNRTFVDHVQITVAEEVIVGRRADYYDRSGVLRDMFQNHLLQLMMIVAMEPPARFEADAVRNEKAKVLQAVRPWSDDSLRRNVVCGRYRGYAQEEGVSPESKTPTFAAMKLHVDNWRWQGAPFYLRSGKAMSCRTTQIVIEFREPPHMLFDVAPSQRRGNQLVIQVQPAEGIHLHLQTKVPDAGMKLRSTDLDFRFADAFNARMPEAYERLLLDVLAGDASLFARADEVELAWKLIDPVAAAVEGPGADDPYEYAHGDWGPTASARWMYEQGREWFDACPVLH